MDIVIIGTGNTATILGRKLNAAGHRIIQIFGRDAKAASELAYELNTESTNYWSVVNRNAHVYLLAVSDIAIEEVAKELKLPYKVVVHTAGAVSKEILKESSNHYGVLYPLQSLKKESSYLPETPILIDASDNDTLMILEILGKSISDTISLANDAQRLKLHLAAVFCNNFVNHMYVLIEEYCQKEGLDFQLLLPLIQETAQRIQTIPPAKSQTGPAKRRDTATIEKHLALMESYPDLKSIYQLLTKSIQQHN
ncbi:Rossmann-like and DUF2520 domain-containing protein [Flavisolibacter tropicus]|uniref:DUF2520 domain-containing protein n=1 Tax=Flavisolibacter tropicus TaxID=1492898 RepID=A0A172TR10_9BACT|nr:Rossmann-like and DUF2520 domain-containing protein [Flavisolibacter tropicus]ANE49519.1 hypothetical protein SY85_02390 [Flavisolibacter tropicus]